MTKNNRQNFSPSVSVIIPFFENVEWLKEAVSSVFAQSYTDFEVIVINDGSKEDMSLFLEEFQKRIHYRIKTNGGPASARNIGIELSRGKYIAFLDSDDIWESQKLETQVKIMRSTNAIWSHTNYSQFNDTFPDKIKELNLGKVDGYLFPASLLSLHIATPTIMIRADILKNKPEYRFQENMRFGQDNYLWLLLSFRYPIIHIPINLCRVRISGHNASKRARAHLQVRAETWKNMKLEHENIFYHSKNLFLIRLFYMICNRENKYLKFIESNFRLGPRFSEFIAKCFYILPYLVFQILFIFWSRKTK